MNRTLFLALITLFLVERAGPVMAQGMDPCPEAANALTTTPDDLSKVQADIDRFTLCLERAQLLKRLNDLATENEASLLGLSEDNPGFLLGAQTGFDNLPTFDRQAVVNPESILPEEPVEEVLPEGWVILSIFGSGTNLSAKITKADGTLAQVREGDRLPDDKMVRTITPTSVILTEGGSDEELNWHEESQ